VTIEQQIARVEDYRTAARKYKAAAEELCRFLEITRGYCARDLWQYVDEVILNFNRLKEEEKDV